MDARLLNSPTGTQAAVVLALLLSIFSAGCTASTAVHPGESTSIVSAQAAEKTAPTSSGGPQEGIKVHGHWTIEVRDPDGTLVIRREFENALTLPSGPAALAGVLGRQISVGLWRIALFGSPSDLCPGGICVLAELPDVLTGPAVFKSLTVTTPTSGPNTNKLVLTGSLTAANATSVQTVSTVNVACTSGTPPVAPCSTGQANPITRTFLNPVVPVAAGQQIQITVVISFS